MPDSLYAQPPLEAAVLFGDIFAADFLFDAWLEDDAIRLGSLRVSGGFTAYSEHAARDNENYLLAHSRVPIAALLVNDDCYAARVFERRDGTRLQFAPVFALAEDETQRHRQLSSADYTLFPLRPDPVFAGGVAELNCPFSCDVADDDARGRLRRKRVAQLGRKLASQLETRWGAHTARRGALVASTTKRKLYELLGDRAESKGTARAIATLLSTTWSLEGGIADRIDTAAERGEPPEAFLGQLIEWTEQIAKAGAEARDALAAIVDD